MGTEEESVVSVFELTLRLRRTLEEMTAGVWVSGEVRGLSRPPSGHLYFSLKDEERDAMVDCVMYRREAMRHARCLEEGARVQLRGRASVYAPRGRLQWICEAARPAGRGALLEALARLRQKLIDEGLTDPARKRPLPTDPKVIGVVTSRVGAAFHDIRTVALRRGNVRIVLAPALVQGEQAPESIIAALDLIEQVAQVEVLIVGRGGGSQEDLMAFNDERVVRRVAACRVPVVSAVGHEIDTSLTDLVADARAATPSEAAELVVPDASDRRLKLTRMRRQLGATMRVRLGSAQFDLDRLRRLLSDPRFILAEQEQMLDELSLRMERAVNRKVTQQRQTAGALRRRLEARHPKVVLEQARGRLSPLGVRLRHTLKTRLSGERAQLSEVCRALSNLSPLAILGRGYALAFDEEGLAIRDASRLAVGQNVRVRVVTGEFAAQVTGFLEPVYTGHRLPHESAEPQAGENPGRPGGNAPQEPPRGRAEPVGDGRGRQESS